MTISKLLSIVVLFISTVSYSQNRVWDLPIGPPDDYVHFLNAGNGVTKIVLNEPFSNDSADVNVYSADPDMVLTHISGTRLATQFGVPTMRLAAAVDEDDVIISGRTEVTSPNLPRMPYLQRMDNAGNVVYSKIFTNMNNAPVPLINSIYVNNDNLDLFESSYSGEPSFYFINGSIDGQFPSALKVDAPEATEFSVAHTAATENAGEYMVLCDLDYSGKQHALILLRMDSSGVQWATQHNYHSGIYDYEAGHGLERLSDGNWVYFAGHSEGEVLVKFDGSGNVLWAKEYFHNLGSLQILNIHETNDGGMLMTTRRLTWPTPNHVHKLDSSGTLLWSQKYEQMNTSAFPILDYFKNDQDQLYGSSLIAITEMDEDINVCDMVPEQGVTQVDVTFDISPVTLNTSPITPTTSPLPYTLISGDLESTVSCVYTGIHEHEEELVLLLYPDPTSDQLNVDLSNVDGNVDIEIFDLQGRTVRTGSTSGGAVHRIEVVGLPSAIYMIVVRTESGISRQRFVKE